MSLFKLVLTFLLIAKFKISLAEKKNSCKHFHEYPIMKFVYGTDCFYNPNVNSNMYKMVADNGYDLKSYNVTTPEGYILTLFRISPKGSNGNGRQPIYIQYGILTDSSVWVMTGKRSLAFSLVEQGYDVWLGNIRSSMYTKTNINFPSKSLRYWDYTIDDLASDDLSSALKEVANVTGKAGEIIYIGHSMGTTIGFMYAAAFPEESKEILKGIILLSPSVYHSTNFLVRCFLASGSITAKVARSLGINRLFYHINHIRPILKLLIKYCPHLLFEVPFYLFSGKTKLFMPEDLMSFLSYFPDTVSINTISHYGQLYHTNKFQKYDYGCTQNKQLYGQNKPPLYDLTKITMPVYMFYGAKDPQIKTKDIQRIYTELGSTEKDMQIVPIGRNESHLQFGHMDFMLAKDIDTLFYPDLYRYLKRLHC